MRIGIDFRGAQCGSGSGQRGIGRYIIELISGILEFAPEHPVTLFVSDPSDPVIRQFESVRIVHVKAPTWTDPQKPIWMKIPKLRSMVALHRRHLRSTIEKQKLAMERAIAENPVDILHVPSGLDIGSYPIFASPVPTSYTLLDTIAYSLPDLFYNVMPVYLREYYDDQVNWLRNKKLVAISESAKAQGIKEFGFLANNVDVVYPAIDPEFGTPQDRPATVGRPYFLFCSVPDPHKNPKNVIRAFAHSGVEADLVFVCAKTGQYIDELNELARSVEISDRFRLTGYLEQKDLVALFQHATALVSPSLMEGFGYPVAQAMLAGVPVITSNCYAQAEIAEGVGWLVDPHSVDQIAKAIRDVDRSKVELGKVRALEFSAESTTRKLVAHYESLLVSRSN